MGTIAKIIKYRKEILEGVFNLAIKDEFVETVSEYRMNICKGCKYYDGKCAVHGTGPCCGACGCSLAAKTRSLSTLCGAIQKGEDPKWLPVISREDDVMLDKKTREELQKDIDNETNTTNKTK